MKEGYNIASKLTEKKPHKTRMSDAFLFAFYVEPFGLQKHLSKVLLKTLVHCQQGVPDGLPHEAVDRLC